MSRRKLTRTLSGFFSERGVNMGKNKVLKFIENWEKNHAGAAKIHLMPIKDGKNIYGIEMRFVTTRYELPEDEFDDLVIVTRRRTGGCLKITSTWSDFRAGIVSMKVAFCNHGYNERKIVNMVEFMLKEIFPIFEK